MFLFIILSDSSQLDLCFISLFLYENPRKRMATTSNPAIIANTIWGGREEVEVEVVDVGGGRGQLADKDLRTKYLLKSLRKDE